MVDGCFGAALTLNVMLLIGNVQPRDVRELSPVLQVDKDEWEAFRSEFSKLTKNYELVLGKLEQAQAQIRMLSQQNEALRTEARVATPTYATKGITEPVKSELAEDKEREPVQKLGEA